MVQSQQSATIRKGRKYDQVIAGARNIFLREGFEGASVDDIAREAGVSKATLYNYFPDKRILFLEICREQCQLQADAAFELYRAGLDIRELLLRGAEIIVRFITSPFAQSIYQLALGEAERFPEIAREYYRSGPGVAHEHVRLVLESAAQRGDLSIQDFNIAAEQFIALCRTDLWLRVSFKITDKPTEAEIRRVAEGAVDTFLARYGTRN